MTFDSKRHEWLSGILAPERRTHIVDVGANPVEPVTYSDLLAVEGCDVTGFEPGAEGFRKLQEIKGPNETYFNFAVGNGETRDLHLMRADTLTSIYKPDTRSCANLGYGLPRGMQHQRTVQLDMVALDTSEVKSFDLLKIDIQGGEIEVFRGAARMLMDAVAVIPEVRFGRMYLDEPMMAGVDQDLRTRGFMLHKYLFTKSVHVDNSQTTRRMRRRMASQLLDGDAVYVRDLAYPERISDEQIKHLALLADGVWFSFDMTLRCLDILVQRNCIPDTAPADYVGYLPSNLV